MFPKVGVKVFWAIIAEKHVYGLFVFLKFSVPEKKGPFLSEISKDHAK